MKTERFVRSRSLTFSRAIALSWLCSEVAISAPVDSEIVILVDGQTFSQASFDLMLDGVADAFEQQSFIDSVTGGPYGSIAASVMVFTGGGSYTAIPWMEMSSAGDLQAFSSSVRNVAAPASFGLISYVDAIAAGAASIANSTAEGVIKQMTIIEDGGYFFFSDTGAEIQAARDSALASGVDVINSVVYNSDGREDVIQDYYDANVVSGGPNGQANVIGGSSFGAPGGALGEAIQESIGETVSQPTIDSNNLAAVPEPSVALLGAMSGLALLVRRRR
ncbi:MAG: DUF1194 domain-containing protein [Roseibacillus sp.]